MNYLVEATRLDQSLVQVGCFVGAERLVQC